ncbi:MAG TPA: hypothetical protein VGD08_24640 [Stellaceae bacterium]|jgi:hypothetical protein
MRRLTGTACLLACCAFSSIAAAADPPKPSLTVVPDQSALLAGQWIGLNVWIDNPTDHPITDLRLRLNAPDFIGLGDPVKSQDGHADCRDTGPVVPFDPIPANSTLDPPRRLCLKAANWVEEQDVNVAFSLVYATTDGAKPQHGVLLVEKKLSIGLFGTDTVAGVSLRLAAYFLPGLFMLMILRVRGIGNLSGTESAAVSIVISVAVLWFVSQFLPQLKIFQDLKFLQHPKGISAELFLIVSLICAAFGLMVAGGHALVAWLRRHMKEARLIATTDEPAEALAKALRQKKTKPGSTPVMLLKRDEIRYAASLWAEADNGDTILLGWFKVRTPDNAKVHARMVKLLSGKKLRRLIALARRKNIAIEESNAVRTRVPAKGEWEPAASVIVRVPKEEVDQITQEPIADLGVTDPPIRIEA